MKILEPANVYHAHPAKGSSFYKKIHTKTLLHAMTDKVEMSDALIMGSALHCAILEPERFNSEFMCEPNKADFPGLIVTVDDIKAALTSILGDKAPKSGTKDKLTAQLLELNSALPVWDVIYKNFEKLAEGKTILTQAQMANVIGMKDAVLSHPIASEVLKGGEAEYSYYVKDPDTGLERKCRPDYHNGGALIDIKTTSDASYEGFAKQIGNLGYHLQAAYYLDTFNQSEGTNYREFFFIAVENKFPFAVAVYRLDENQCEVGRSASQKSMRIYAEFLKDHAFDDLKSARKFGYSSSIIDIQVPYYLLDKIQFA